MPRDATATAPRLHAVVEKARRFSTPARGVPKTRRLRLADVALFYGERSGGIRTYLDAKARHAAETGDFEHHVLIPGPQERHDGGRHELPSLRLAAANGYRVPLGARALQRTLRLLRPDVVLLHDPFWRPLDVAGTAHAVGAKVVAVHHGSSALDAAALPGPSRAYEPLLRAWLRRSVRPVDAIMSNVDALADCGRAAALPLRLGVHPAFRPQPLVARGDHVVYVGRLSREKGVLELLETAVRSREPWPLRFVGSGPLERRLRDRVAQAGLTRRVSFRPFVRDPERLARTYAGASCVVMPGEHETFGLVALEAAASGARVVSCATAPATRAVGELGFAFAPGDPAGLERAIEAARAEPRDLTAAAGLAWQHRWSHVFEAELAAMRELVA